VGNGREAFERWVPGRYEVVLIDLVMPEIPGDQVAQEMKRRDPSVSTVLVTGWPLGEEDPRWSLFDFHLRKPFGDLTRISDVVAQAVALHDTRAKREREGADRGIGGRLPGGTQPTLPI